MVSFVFLLMMAVFLFRVPIKGSFLTLFIATVIYVVSTTGFGQLISSFTRTQFAAVFATAILSIVPAVNFSGLFAPVSSLLGGANSWPDVSIGLVPADHGRGLRQSARNDRPLAECRRDHGHCVTYLILSLVFLASRRHDMSLPSTVPVSKLAEARTLTLRDHIFNIFRLVIKELRSIRAEPTMLILVAYAFSISVNTVATGAVTEATNLSVGIVDEDGSDLSEIAEGLVRPTFQPAVQIRAPEIDAKMDKGELLFVVEIPPNFQANILAQRKTEIQINVDATAVAQAGNGASYLRAAIFNEVQNFIFRRGTH